MKRALHTAAAASHFNSHETRHLSETACWTQSNGHRVERVFLVFLTHLDSALPVTVTIHTYKNTRVWSGGEAKVEAPGADGPGGGGGDDGVLLA